MLKSSLLSWSGHVGKEHPEEMNLAKTFILHGALTWTRLGKKETNTHTHTHIHILYLILKEIIFSYLHFRDSYSEI